MHLVYFLIGKSDALCNRPYGTYAPDDGDTDKQESYDLGYKAGVEIISRIKRCGKDKEA